MKLPFPFRARWLARIISATWAAVLLLLAWSDLAAKTEGDHLSLPQGSSGIAAAYPGDAGLEEHSSVVFVERFEGTLDEILERWENVSRRDILSLSGDVPPAASGGASLQITHTGGDETGGHLYRRLLPGYDKLHWRFYVKFDSGIGPLHHTPRIGGIYPSTPWPPGGAGSRPAGDANFRAGIGPHYGPDSSWDYYVYWQEMRGSPPAGRTWGNSFIRNPELEFEKDRWICVEVMVQLNRPGESDGELALWIDGKPVSHLGPGFPRGTWIWDKFHPGHPGPGVRWNEELGGREEIPGDRPFEGFHWRTSEELKINFIWMLLYITQADEGHRSCVWFDHIVVAEEYIGPIRSTE